MGHIENDLRYHWDASEVCFDCPCGETDIRLNSDGDSWKCECGRVFRLVHRVEVEP